MQPCDSPQTSLYSCSLSGQVHSLLIAQLHCYSIGRPLLLLGPVLGWVVGSQRERQNQSISDLINQYEICV